MPSKTINMKGVKLLPPCSLAERRARLSKDPYAVERVRARERRNKSVKAKRKGCHCTGFDIFDDDNYGGYEGAREAYASSHG